MKQRMKWGIWILAVLAFIEYWRVLDIEKVIDILTKEDANINKNSYLIYGRAGGKDISEEEYVGKNELEMNNLKNIELEQQKRKKILTNRKIYIFDGYSPFRTAIFVTDNDGNLLYFDRDMFWCCIGEQTLAGDFINFDITENEVIYHVMGRDFDVRIPLHPNWLQRADAKIIQWISKVIY